jgi:hypothetical protein
MPWRGVKRAGRKGIEQSVRDVNEPHRQRECRRNVKIKRKVKAAGK